MAYVKWTRILACATMLGVMATGNVAAQSGKPVIGVSKPNLKGPWPTAELYGILDEAKKFGFEVVVQDAGGYANVDKQLNQISNLVIKKVSALLLEPIDPVAMNSAARQAKAAGILLLGAGVNVVASEVEPDAAVSSSHCSIGRELAKGAKKLFPNGGTIGILAGPAGAHWSAERLKCFKEDIASAGFKIVAEQTNEQDASVSLTRAGEMLQRNPNLDMLYGADDVYGVGAARAARAVGRCGKTKVIFSVLGEEAEEMMRAGCVDYVVAQQPVLIGRLEVRLIDRMLKGEKPEPKIQEVPLIGVTPENLNSVDKTNIQPPKGWRP